MTLSAERILVTGGVGYIGSHTCFLLADRCAQLVVLDHRSPGEASAQPPALFYLADIGDRDKVGEIIRRHAITAVIHFAAYTQIEESIDNPAKYYDNNVVGSFNLIRSCMQAGVRRFIFSSSAAVYGIQSADSVDEQARPGPINPYGQSKLMTERMLHDMAAGGAFHYAALRYFNVAGAAQSGLNGQITAAHLIKVASEAACGVRDRVVIFGNDYPTPDGTCIRDYIHVDDLARAHIDALGYLQAGRENLVLNCGYGHGYSVHQVIARMRAVSGVDFKVELGDRRAGDAPRLIADNRLIRKKLDWQPQLDNLDLICRSALAWEQRRLSAGASGSR